MSEGRYLLLTSCSERKRTGGELKAIERYDGPSFRLIRKHVSSNLDVLILSAKHGLIKGDEPLAWYDQRMSKVRARELRDGTTSDLIHHLGKIKYRSILVNLGKDYHEAIDWKMLGYQGNVAWTEGTIGVRLHQLKEWLVKTEEGIE